METYMECYFDEIFKKLNRDCLSERYKRRELVRYFGTVIAGCSKGQEVDSNVSCRHFVRAALRYHNKCKEENGGVCLMGKYHNVLYIAMKVSFDWSLQDNATVAALLDEIYGCEGTFERIFLGAIFGTSAPHFLAGWKSDFLDKEENIHALVFFLDHATNANLEYYRNENGRSGNDVGNQAGVDGNGSKDDINQAENDVKRQESVENRVKTYRFANVIRFIDVPLESCGMASPVRVVIQMGASEMLLILLRFGARVVEDNNSTNPIETILDRLNEYDRKYPYELVSCLKIILRVIPTVNLTVDKNVFKHLELPKDYNYQRRLILQKYGHIMEDHLIPSSRCGIRPTELKHLCRCKIREMLWKNFQLPFGTRRLNLPNQLVRYLDICED